MQQTENEAEKAPDCPPAPTKRRAERRGRDARRELTERSGSPVQDQTRETAGNEEE